MNDTELLDALQKLMLSKPTTLRTCRSGIKMEVADGDHRTNPVREYFAPDERNASEDIRKLIVKALESETCDHKHYNFKEHGRRCTCGPWMVDPGD